MADREGINELVALVDRLERLLERSGLAELEVEHDGTTIVLRTPAAITPTVSAVAAAPAVEVATPEAVVEPRIEEPVRPRGAHAITAPLTGVYYRSPSPGAEPYVREGAGQKLPHRAWDSGGDYEVIGGVLLEHAPHGVDVLGGVAPVADGV